MIGKIDKTPQLNIFKIPLNQFINLDHQLCLLSKKIDWDKVEEDFSQYYCADNGRPSIPIRKIVGVILLMRTYNQSDENVVERWKENPYWQYFCGETYFQYQQPFDPTELIKFRQRIGESGAEKILSLSINLFVKKEIEEKEVLIDTTVQEKNITFPTDTKLQKKIIEKCRKIADNEGIILRQSYKRILKQLMIDQRFREHPKRRKKANAAARKIKTIAGRVIRDIERKMNDDQLQKYSSDLNIFKIILSQQKNTKKKIYSIHEPHTQCIAKGKESKKYEFGNKTSIVKTRKSGIIIGALAFKENIYDGDTLEPQLEQIDRLTNYQPEIGIVDRGYRGRKKIFDTKIICPKRLPKSANSYQKQKTRKQFRARAGVEPIIGHVKYDHRMIRNYLSGELGDTMNTLLAAAGFNMKKMLNRLKNEARNIIFHIFKRIFPVNLCSNYLIL
ncbi:MAG: IS5 family transposase [Bacteroidales bacterium]|nr:IS5 family transposase [Bacteroidales bacterium]